MTTVYINGEPYQAVRGLVNPLIVDHPILPGAPCASHNIGEAALAWLKRGHGIRTLGNTYSLNPPPKET